MMDSMTFDFQSQRDADGIMSFSLPRSATLVGVKKTIRAVSTALTSHNIDITQSGITKLAGITGGAKANGETDAWLSKHLGGTAETVELVKDDIISINVNNVDEATTANFCVQIFLLWGEL